MNNSDLGVTPPAMSRRRIAFLMEQTLGSITHYLNLKRAEALAQDITPAWLPIDYQPGALPWALTGSLRARRALSEVSTQVEGCFIHTTTIALLASGLFRGKPAVLSSDGTPMNKREMRAYYGLKPESRLAESAKRAVYRRVFSRATGFVAWSDWTKASFVNDYGCREEDVAVIPPGIDLEQFKPGGRGEGLPRILFVGGDFVRKGGDLLLEVFRKRLRGRAQLVLVTGAPVIEEPGVEVHRNVSANSEKLRSLYATSDVFTLPSRADCYSLVCMEALAAGLPLVVTRMGGLPDMIQEGRTGHVVEVDDAAQLGDALESLVADARKRQEMGAASRAEAVRRFDAFNTARQLFEFVRSRC
jgi:glycosyltransferase involved in cell wall biosynthesis